MKSLSTDRIVAIDFWRAILATGILYKPTLGFMKFPKLSLTGTDLLQLFNFSGIMFSPFLSLVGYVVS